MIKKMEIADAEAVLDIYAFGLVTRNATFETRVPTWEEWNQSHLAHSRFVFIRKGTIAGWTALSPVSRRRVYQGVCEVSVYVAKEALGQGLGTKLLKAVINSSEKNGIWTLFASLFPENIASVRMHKKCGFRAIGTREKIASLDGKWRDTVIMERRSRIAGKV